MKGLMMKQEWIDEALEKIRKMKPDPITRIMSPQNWLNDLNDDELIDRARDFKE